MVKALAKFNQPIYGLIVIFILALAVRLIKANFFPFWHDEIITLNNTYSFAEALRFARVDHNPPFLYLFTAFVKIFLGSSPFVLRLPHILAGALTITFAYGLLLFLKAKRPLLLALPLVFYFLLVYYSQETRFYSLIFLFSLLSFWLGFELLFGKSFRPWSSVVLGIFLAILTLLHYFTFTHLVSLAVALILIWFLQRDFKTWQRLLYLAGSYLIVFIGNLAWLDEILDNLQAKARAPELHFLDSGLLTRLAYKFAGGGNLWTIFIFLVFGLTIIFWLFRWLIQKRGLPFISSNFEQSVSARIGRDGKDKFVFFLLIYLLVFLLLFWGFGSERIIFHRYLFFLFWPFIFILLLGIDLAFNSSQKLFQILAGSFLIVFLASHFFLLKAYFSSSYRVEDFRTPAQFIDELIKEGKSKVYMAQADQSTTDDLKFYLRIYQDKLYSGFEESQQPTAREFFKDGIYLYFGTNPETASDKKRESELSLIFPNKKVFWEDKNFEYLAKRAQHPFLQEGSNVVTLPGLYRRLVIFW